MHPNIALVCLGSPVVAIVGAQTGFLIGRTAGRRCSTARTRGSSSGPTSPRREETIERYGVGKAIVLARFIPIVRTFLNPLVGAGGLPARTFALWNVVGGVLWGVGVTLLGYYLGQVDVIGKNLEVFAVLVVAISLLPIAFELLRPPQALPHLI